MKLGFKLTLVTAFLFGILYSGSKLMYNYFGVGRETFVVGLLMFGVIAHINSQLFFWLIERDAQAQKEIKK